MANYLDAKAGLGAYRAVLLDHDITGESAGRLSERDLKEMGMATLGDRKRFAAAIDTVKHQARKIEREQTIWEGKERLFASWWDRIRQTGCGCCPIDASSYKLTGTHLTISTPRPNRWGPIRCCCGHEYTVDNVDLSYVLNVDMVAESPKCFELYCCNGLPRDRIQIKTKTAGLKEVILDRGEGAPVSKKIMNQVEEMQITFRRVR